MNAASVQSCSGRTQTCCAMKRGSLDWYFEILTQRAIFQLLTMLFLLASVRKTHDLMVDNSPSFLASRHLQLQLVWFKKLYCDLAIQNVITLY